MYVKMQVAQLEYHTCYKHFKTMCSSQVTRIFFQLQFKEGVWTHSIEVYIPSPLLNPTQLRLYGSNLAFGACSCARRHTKESRESRLPIGFTTVYGFGWESIEYGKSPKSFGMDRGIKSYTRLWAHKNI